MSNVPIFDDAYWEQRAQQQRVNAWMRYMQGLSSSFGTVGDSPESLREQYALGRIDFETFERRLDRVLR